MRGTKRVGWCGALLAWGIILALPGCGGGTEGGPGSGDGGVGADGSVAPDGGDAGYLALGDSQSATVRSDPHEYRTADLPAGTYALILSNDTDSVLGSVYGPSGAALIEGCRDGGCLFEHPGGALRVVVSSEFGVSEFYTVSVVRLETLGTATEPIPVAFGETLETATPASGVSYFSFTVTRAGTYFIGYLSHRRGVLAGNVDFDIYADADFSSAPVDHCAFVTTSPCRLLGLATGVYGVRVSEVDGEPLAYEWVVAPGVSEGAPTERVSLTLDVPHLGAVDGRGTSFYEFVSPPNDGGLLITFEGAEQGIGATLRDAVSGEVVGSCGGACEVGGLSASTRYFLDVSGPFSNTAYTITLGDGPAVGTPDVPVDFPLGQDVPIRLEPGGESYYRLRVPLAGSYYVLFGVPAPDTADISVDLDGQGVWGVSGPSLSQCDEVGCFTFVEANHDYLLEVRGVSGGAVDRTLRIEKASFGNGSYANPLPLTIGETYPIDGNSIYTMTTSAGELPVLVAAFDQLDASIDFGTGAAVSEECGINGNYAPRCKLHNVEPSSTYLFAVNAPRDSGARFAVLRVDPSLGCAPEAARCDDYEGGVAPADYVEPVDSDGPWVIDAGEAITGSYGFSAPSAGNIALSCFEVTRAEPSWALAFSSTTVAEPVSFPAPRVYIDGVAARVYGTGSVATGYRWVVSTVLGPNHVYRLCYTDGAPATAVDDLAFY